MINFRILLLLFVLTNVAKTQISKSDDPRLRIDFWLKSYMQDSHSEKYQMAVEVFESLLKVADKPIGALPKLYIFPDLEFGKLFTLPDGSVILPSRVIDFCLKDRKHAKARLAFLLGHEIKHVVRDDYWIQQVLEFAQTANIEKENDQLQRVLEQMQWNQSLQLRKSIETDADEYGILYASLAGYDIRSIISSSNTFISDYYLMAKIDIHGDITNNSASERQRALTRRLADIIANLDLFDFGVRLYAIGEYDAAIELLQKFVTQYPSREVFNNLGMCYYQKALMYYTKWKHKDIDKDPNLIFRVSMQIDPISRAEIDRRAIAMYNEQLFNDMIGKAIENFDEAQTRDPNYEIAQNNLGCTFLLKGEIDFAKGNFKRAMDYNPYCKESHNNLGVAFLIEGNVREAVTHFLAALSPEVDYPEALYNLGQLNYQSGNIAEATKYFEKYLNLDKTSVYADAVKKQLKIESLFELSTITNEKINGQSPLDISQITKKQWSGEFITPSAKIFVSSKTNQSTQYFQFISTQLNEKIIIILATENYRGHSEKNIGIEAPEKLIEDRYPYSHTLIKTTRGNFRIYKDLGLVFEVRNSKVHCWYLYEVF